MSNDQAPSIRVSIWRSHRPGRHLTYYTGRADAPVMRVGDADAMDLLEEVFAWHTRDDVWGGLDDLDLRTRFIDRIKSEFDPLQAPFDRSMAKLGSYLNDLRPVATSLASKWTNSKHAVEGEQTSTIRINPLLAFMSQMTWIHGTFQHMPDASVMIR